MKMFIVAFFVHHSIESISRKISLSRKISISRNYCCLAKYRFLAKYRLLENIVFSQNIVVSQNIDFSQNIIFILRCTNRCWSLRQLRLWHVLGEYLQKTRKWPVKDSARKACDWIGRIATAREKDSNERRWVSCFDF